MGPMWFSNLAVGWHGVASVKLGAKAGCLALPHPLAQELVAVSVLSIIAYHAPPLLSEASHHSENTYAGPRAFRSNFSRRFFVFLLYIKAIWFVSRGREASLGRVVPWENAF
jgi:hypothetical protein